MLFVKGASRAIIARRILADRFSNGDKNEVIIEVESLFAHTVKVELIDEIPVQFQRRNFSHPFKLNGGQFYRWSYFLIPVIRGEFMFGALHLYIMGCIGFISRRYSFAGMTLLDYAINTS